MSSSSDSCDTPVYWSEDYKYQAFDISQSQEIKQFFEKYGFVVVDNVLSPEECNASINEVWNEVSEGVRLKRKDPDTWLDDRNYSTKLITRMGIVGSLPVMGYWAFKNRVNPKVYHVFRLLLEQDELWTSFDRFGFLRPTKNVGGKEIDKPEWRTAEKWLHWDLNPWQPFILNFNNNDNNNNNNNNNNNENSEEVDPKHSWNPQRFIIENNELSSPPFRRVQGIVSFVDVDENDGGFLTVPGTLHHIDKWANHHSHLKKEGNFCSIPKDNVLYEHTQRIPMKASSIVVWDSRQAHANFPNNSEKFRICQYIKMFSYANNRTKSCREEGYMRHLVKDMLPSKFIEDLKEEKQIKQGEIDLALKLLRLRSWDKDRESSVRQFEIMYDENERKKPNDKGNCCVQ